MKKNVERKFLLSIILLYIIIQLLTFRTGIGIEDFREIEMFRQVNNGRIPYQDFYWTFGLVGLYFGSFLAKFFGNELIVMRLFAILIGLIGIPFVYNISKKIMTRGFSLLAAFCCFILFYFPSYSFNHYLSVLSIVITIWYAYKFFFGKKKFDLFMWGILLTLTFYIRPIPTGIALAVSSLFIIIVFSFQDNRRFAFLKNFLFLFSFFIAITLLYYFATDNLWFRYDIMRLTIHGPKNNIIGIPNTIRMILNFAYQASRFNSFDIDTIYKLVSFLNLLSGHFVYWFIFIMPTLYLIVFFTKSILKKKLNNFIYKDYFIIFLCLLNFLMCFYFHHYILVSKWPDPNGGGLLWLTVAQYLLQPGIIVSIYLLYTFRKRIQKPFLTSIISCILVLSVGLVPKVTNLRYMVIKMPLGHMYGIRGIYLNDFYEKIVVPAVEYINNNSNVPEYIFVIGYCSGFYILTNKKPLIPEWVDIAVDVSTYKYIKTRKKQFLFPGRGKRPLDPDDIDNIILNRLKDKQPCIIYVSGALSKTNLKWIDFFKNNYYPIKTFTYERVIKGGGDDNPSITIYLPDQ